MRGISKVANARGLQARRGAPAAAVLAVLLSMLLGSGTAMAAGCANEQLRAENNSLALPNCRAYELVSPDSNHASLGQQASGSASADGQTFFYQTIDAPENALSASPFNPVIATRGQASGWAGTSLSPPNSAPNTSFNSTLVFGLSPDLKSTFTMTDQPLVGGAIPPGANAFVGSPAEGYKLITDIGFPFFQIIDVYSQAQFLWGNNAFSNIYFQPPNAQLPTDPTSGYNTYAWSSESGLRLVGILPDGTPAPNGASLVGGTMQGGSEPVQSLLLQPASEDGRFVLFRADSHLYLRDMVAESTVEIGPSAFNPTPNSTPNAAGVTADGSTVLFLSRAELTSDANTGEDGSGNSTEAGQDLYSYDRATGVLTDLSVDTDPADAATGANVQAIMAATPDAGYIYFTATGVLAAGAQPGRTSLYAWHDGQVEFVADASHLPLEPVSNRPNFAMSEDGRSVAFSTTDPLTSYDNTDPVTRAPHYEVFVATLGQPIRCASCRTDRSRPTGDSLLPRAYRGVLPSRGQRVLVDGGRRLFFQSTDELVPTGTNGEQQVYQYENGAISPISDPSARNSAQFLDASASGDDVFFVTYNELVPNKNGNDPAVYDARVGGGFPVPQKTSCAGEDCRSPGRPVPSSPHAASTGSSDSGNASTEQLDVSAPKSLVVHGSSGTLTVMVSAKGRLSATGRGLKKRTASASKPMTVSVRVRLKSGAAKTLRQESTFRSKAMLKFKAADGRMRSTAVALTFKAKSGRKG